jgi:hypothetical protein
MPRDGAARDGEQRGRSGRHGAGNGAGRGPGRRDRDGRPRPTFTPREGYEPPPDGGRREDYPAAQTTFLPPVPAGYPQQSYTQPFAYPEAPEQPLPRPAGQDQRPPSDDEGLGLRILEVPPPGDDLGTGPQAIVTDFGKFARTFPDFKFKWNAVSGAAELYDAFKRAGLTHADYTDKRFTRLKWLRYLLDSGRLDGALRWSKNGRTETKP